jgi:methyltransferase (TIGR00027 family)
VESGTRSTTADFAAMMRATHLILDGEPKILGDVFALRLSGFENEKDLCQAINKIGIDLASKLPGSCPENLMEATRAAITVRSRMAEERLYEAIKRGVSQYVILGAGLDSSAYRLPDTATNIRVFEVDFPATQEWKRAQIDKIYPQIANHVTFVQIDFEQNSLFACLREHGFDPRKPAFFSWLGVVWYISEGSFFETLREIASSANGSEVVFEYPVTADLVEPIDRPLAEMIKQLGSARGEPIGSGFNPTELVRKVITLGFETVSDLSPDDIQAQYFLGRQDRLRMPSIGHFLSARR